ncbi:putative harbinger transposase-derived nuclease domain-containing protein [Helianthus annuus]|uniref:protein ALP1-like n=1 Tax=Helianthus annuus TaxID=4232 RepID=UPI000B8F4A4B|nr:protein ALP1-like [Helianthus annuus]KAJ0487311.1 putative harbinger transposase-derived nuclease domain-containing protein [Helianthus annuus]KAJ0661425.1 putative harbinger transposase-derived nuclease domain-containing protein [Helianthus annuus]KAJ0855616.1 putative harbinger transposase-derived nuclease domain-containing protein [Helianthus annuus]
MGPTRGSKSKKKSTTTLSTPPLIHSQPSDWWHDFSKRFHGDLKKSTDSQSFESMFKMSTKTFDYITSFVNEEMSASNKNYIDLNGNQLNLYDMVGVALRRLGSGDSLSTVGTSLNLHQTTVAGLTKRFVDALVEKTHSHIYWPSTELEMEDVKSKFEKIGGLPNCCGAIGTTHILMRLLNVECSTNAWCDRENNQSMVLSAIVDPTLRFRDISGGWPGSLTDEYIFKESAFLELCKDGVRLNGKQRQLSEGNEIHEYIVGNSGFPLLKWMLTPYQGDQLGDYEMKFNEMLFKTQMVTNEAFVKLKENWKILKGELWRPDKNRLPLIITACCILHNILIDMEDEVQETLVFSGGHDLDYRPVFCDADDDDQVGAVLREKICRYLSFRENDGMHHSSAA